MANYLVHCDGCGMPKVVNNPNKFSCTNCGYDTCTVDEVPVIGAQAAVDLEDAFRDREGLNGDDCNDYKPQE